MSLIIAPLEALTDHRLTDTERRVLLALYSFRNKNANTVWPSLESLAARAQIKDVPRISKITKSLAEKGWLTKRKRGFTGCNAYSLTHPSEATPDEASVEENANLANFTNLAENTVANLANFTKSNLANFTKCNELQNEQQIEQQIRDTTLHVEAVPDAPPDRNQTPKTKPAKTPAVQLDYSSWPEQPSAQVHQDWLAARKAKKLPISQTVITRFGNELTRAWSSGHSVDDCLAEAITGGWQGFKAQWMDNQRGNQNGKGQHQPSSVVDRVRANVDKIAREREAAMANGRPPCDPDRGVVDSLL